MITFSSDYSWDFNPSDGIEPGSIDFVGVAIHEIGHSLGFSSVVDIIDSNPGNNESTYAYLTALDLFRYSNSTSFQIERDLSDENTRVKYFSIDGGATSIATFSNGATYGDGYQASHWKAGQDLGIMSPYISYGIQALISETDLMAMDVIGYDRNFTWNWDGAASGSWDSAWNWNTYCVPNNAKLTANFDGNGVNPTIALGISPTVAALSVVSDNMTLSMSDNSLTAGEVRIGGVAGKTGGLSLQGPGRLYTTNLYVGGDSHGSDGTGTLSIGAGIEANVSGTLHIYSSPSNRTTMSAGGSLSANNIVNQGVFDAPAGQLTVSGTFDNSGTATLGGTQNWAAGSSLFNSGSLTLLTDLGAGGTGPTLALKSGTADIHSAQHLTGLSLEGGNSRIMGPYALMTNQFSATGGALDLYTGGLIVNYPGDTVYASVNAAILAGFIYTSHALDYPITEAAFDNASVHLDSWMGEALSGYSQILTQYAYVGDVNLDGMVDENDLMNVLGNMNHAGTWLDGDVNHDGYVTLTDYSLVQAYMGAGETVPMMSMKQWSQLPPGGLAVLVPEPGILGLGLMGILTCLGRRRKSR